MPSLKGLTEWGLAVGGLLKAMDEAVQTGTKKAALETKRQIQAGIEGPPRWQRVSGHRWEHHEREGPPGVLTGKLRRRIGYGRIEKVGPGSYKTRIAARRPYSSKVEAKYPYFRPGVDRAHAEVGRIYEREYAAVIAGLH